MNLRINEYLLHQFSIHVLEKEISKSKSRSIIHMILIDDLVWYVSLANMLCFVLFEELPKELEMSL